MKGFQRPHAVWTGFPYRRDGWYFIAFGVHYRVRHWRVYRWR